MGEWSTLNWLKQSSDEGMPKITTSFPAKVKPIYVERKNKVRSFLEKLPKMPSHYCRSSSRKLQDMKMVKIDVNHPSKDQYDNCLSYNLGNITEKE